MTENEIITQQDPQMQLFSQLMEGILKKLERYCATARPMLGGEVYLTGEEVCRQLRLSTRTLQEYRNAGILPFYKIGGKILYKQSEVVSLKVCNSSFLSLYFHCYFILFFPVFELIYSPFICCLCFLHRHGCQEEDDGLF